MKYTEEMKQWLKSNAPIYEYRKLVELFNQRYHANQTYDTLRKYCLHTLKIVIGNNERIKIKHIDRLIEIYTQNIHLPMNKIAEIYNNEFNTNYAQDSLEVVLHKKGFYKRDFGHHQGDTLVRTPLGSIKLNTYGYEMIKVSHGTFSKKRKDAWITKAQYMYEQYNNVKLKDDEFVIFLNGDNRNYDKDNLMIVKKSYRPWLCNQGFMNNEIRNPELLKTAIEICKAREMIKNIEGEQK